MRHERYSNYRSYTNSDRDFCSNKHSIATNSFCRHKFRNNY